MTTRFSWPIRFLAGVMAVVGGTGLFMAWWLAGGVSRVKVRKTSPDGQVEAVCRARLPESTEYDIYLRRWWQPFGMYLAHSGTESMGRCRDVVWSPDGTLLLVVNEGNTIGIIDVASRRQFDAQRRFAPGETWNYASARIITSLRFTSSEDVEFEHCDRQQAPRGSRDFSRCGRDVRRDRARLDRNGTGMSLNVIAGS